MNGQVGLHIYIYIYIKEVNGQGGGYSVYRPSPSLACMSLARQLKFDFHYLLP